MPLIWVGCLYNGKQENRKTGKQENRKTGKQENRSRVVTRKELWEIYTKKNPHWLTDNVTVTLEGLKKLVDQTFDMGFKAGAESSKTRTDDIYDIFNKMR